MEKYLINPNQRIATINKDIYGHFSEHLGRCIYDGIFVGKDSKIPNVNDMHYVCGFSPSEGMILPTSTTGRTVLVNRRIVKR